MSKKEKRNGKKGMKYAAGLLAAILCLGLAGCSQSSKLADCFDKETLEKDAKAVIEMGESDDYEGLTGRFDESIAGSLTQESYAQYLELVKSKGEFKEYGNVAFVGQHDDKTDKDYAAVVVVREYEEGKLQYVVGYDEDMDLVQYTVK